VTNSNTSFHIRVVLSGVILTLLSAIECLNTVNYFVAAATFCWLPDSFTMAKGSFIF